MKTISVKNKDKKLIPIRQLYILYDSFQRHLRWYPFLFIFQSTDLLVLLCESWKGGREEAIMRESISLCIGT